MTTGDRDLRFDFRADAWPAVRWLTRAQRPFLSPTERLIAEARKLRVLLDQVEARP